MSEAVLAQRRFIARVHASLLATVSEGLVALTLEGREHRVRGIEGHRVIPPIERIYDRSPQRA